MLLKTKTTADIPAKIPYIYADNVLTKEWKEKLSGDNNVKVGLCWTGVTSLGENYILDYTKVKRSIPLKKLAPLADSGNVSFYSLQISEDLNTGSDRFIIHDFGLDFDKRHGAFMDTAAVMKNLDVVITTDTSIVHLAGALGIKTWLLLPFSAEWRWLIDRVDSPWYPTARLFRQPKIGDWDSVVQDVKNELKKVAKHKKVAQYLQKDF